jgi:hypothetical protein
MSRLFFPEKRIGRMFLAKTTTHNRYTGTMARLRQVSNITGFRACGKSAIGEALILAFNNDPRIRLLEMSDAIKHFLRLPTSEIGAALQPHRSTMDAGGIILDGVLIYKLCLSYLRFMDNKDHRDTEHLILTGGFRSVDETRLFNKCGTPVEAIHITGNYIDMCIGIWRRLGAGVKRLDSMRPEALGRAWDEYNTYTIPALKLVRGCHQIAFRQNFRKKVEQAIVCITLPDHVRARMLRRIAEPSHPACRFIKAIDTKPIKGPARSAIQPQVTTANSSYQTDVAPIHQQITLREFAMVT